MFGWQQISINTLYIVFLALSCSIFLALRDQGGHLSPLFLQRVKTPFDRVDLFLEINISFD